jgi:hypothetical protein
VSEPVVDYVTLQVSGFCRDKRGASEVIKWWTVDRLSFEISASTPLPIHLRSSQVFTVFEVSSLHALSLSVDCSQ